MVWWTASFVFAAAAALLGLRGRTRAAAVTRKLAPGFMHRLMLGALSVQLLSAPVASATAATAPGPEWAPTQQQSPSAPQSPGFGGRSVFETPRGATAAAGIGRAGSGSPARPQATETVPHQVPVQVPQSPESTKPADEAPLGEGTPSGETTPSAERARATAPEAGAGLEATRPPTSNPGWRPATLPVSPGLLAPPAARPSADAPEAGGVTAGGATAEGIAVHAGDTLWDIAARYLGEGASDVDIALEWPRWFEANRALIGPNPNVLRPGQILQAPLSGKK